MNGKRIKLFSIILTLFLTGRGVLAQSRTNKDSICRCYDSLKIGLPETFKYNAKSICRISPDEPRANKIRTYLISFFDTCLNDSQKQVALFMEAQYSNKKISKRSYNRFIKKFWVPKIHLAHKQAYVFAGCKSDAAPYWQWKIVCKRKVKSARWSWFCVKTFGGSCSGRIGKW